MDLWTAAASRLSLRSPARVAARMSAFARAEKGSQLDMLVAASETEDLTLAGQFLRHAHDESRHARAFSNRARELGEDGWIHADGGRLLSQLGPAKFLAFVHQGEARAIQRFVVIQDTLIQAGDTRSAAVFGALLEDEHRHAAYTRIALDTVTDTPAAALRQARRWSFWQGYRRLTAATAQAMHDAGAWLLYLSLFPLALWLRWVRPARSGWV
ncbi:MAG: rubrerythrin [Cognaticolwellia sp.]|jgi:rubrerythrin